MVMIVHAAIAYGDALTASAGGKVNQKDHAALPRLIRDALGQRTDGTQIARLQRILEEKNAASYGLAPAEPTTPGCCWSSWIGSDDGSKT